MKLHIRIDDENQRHRHFTVFANGANCGRLCMERAEADAFFQILNAGRRSGDTVQITEEPNGGS